MPKLQHTEDLGRSVMLRDAFDDRQVWSDTFVGRYHIPPKRMPDPTTVLDCGCNIGLTTAHYQALWPKAVVVGVEMDKGCAELARLNAPEAKIRNYAISDADGTGSYDPSVRSDSYSLGAGPESVVTHTLAYAIRDAFDGPVDFLKLDIEGAEWDVFAGPTEWVSLVSHVLVELHAPGEASADVVRRGIVALEDLGFVARHHKIHPQAVYAVR